VKKIPKKKSSSMNLRPVVAVILALLASGLVVHCEGSNLRFDLRVGRSA